MLGIIISPMRVGSDLRSVPRHFSYLERSMQVERGVDKRQGGDYYKVRGFGIHNAAHSSSIMDTRYAPSSRGIINSTLPIELVSKIWHFMTIVDLLRYAWTSKANYNDVHNAIRKTVHGLLASFCASPQRFLDVLEREHAVISGSVALYVMYAISFNGVSRWENGWYPSDIDVYVPFFESENEDDQPPFVAYMIGVEGYRMSFSQGRERAPAEYSMFPEVKEVIYLEKGSTYMDVIVSASCFCMAPMFKFHSTPVMNCISGNGIFSAYPNMTCNGQGIFNPMVFNMDAMAPHMPPSNVRDALHKYEARGFEIRRNPACWPNDRHKCMTDVECPHTRRNVDDGGCLYTTFRKIGENDGINSKTAMVSEDVFDGRGIVMWHFGGDACDSLVKRLTGYVHCCRQSQVRGIM